MLTFDVITLFPQLIEPHLKELPFKRALARGLVKVNLHDLRKYAIDKHGTVDDKPYGGGVGMILMVEPIYKALSDIVQELKGKSAKFVILSPRGQTYSQSVATEYKNENHIILLCGRYEGIDARVEQLGNLISNEIGAKIATQLVSIGNYILSGGEIATLAIMESTTRLIPGVLEKETALENESFNTAGQWEHPQYTRPEKFMNLTVPKVLLSGDHKKIQNWKNVQV